MRLTRLDLAPYGRFAAHALTFRPDAGLHVVLGANESGKTTTLSAIGDLLFGFGRDTSYGFAYDQRLLRVGGAFRLADGAELALRRRKGNKDTLLDAADKPVSEEPLRRALGAIDRKTFENEFGLTARALREGGEALLRAGGGLAETLAAGSASLSALSRLRETLAAEADALFTSRRSGAKPFYIALDRHDEAERKLREAVVTPAAIEAAEARLREAEARETELKGQHEDAGKSLARRHRARRTWEKLARLDALAQERADFADLPAFPDEALTEARAALDADRGLRGDLDRLAAEDARDEAVAAGLGVDAALLSKGEAIDALVQQLGAVRKSAEDLPRRHEARRHAENQLDYLARRLGLSGHAALLAAAPTDPAVARARASINARRRAEERRAEAAARLDAAVAERDRLSASAAAPAIDPDPFKRRLAAFADAAAEADALRRERADADTEARALAADAAALDPNAGDIEALARLPLPDEASLAAAAAAWDRAGEALKLAEQRRAAAKRALEVAESALARREGAGAAATRADWEAARVRRERAFDKLAEALDGEAAERRERMADARALALAADATVEAVLDGSERAARLQAAREEAATRREDLARAEAEQAEAQASVKAAGEAHGALWAPSRLAIAAPARMMAWRARATALLARRAESEKRRARLDARAEKAEAARASLLAWLRESGAAADPALSFEEAYRSARAHLEGLQKAWLDARDIELRRARAQTDAREAETALARETATLAEQAAEWPNVVSALGLEARAGLEEAEAALSVWNAVPLPRENLKDTAHRIETMRADMATFDAGVAAVVAAVAPDLSGGRPAETLDRLAKALLVARRAADERDRLARAAVDRAATRRGIEARRATLAATLGQAIATLCAADRDGLAVTLGRLERRRAIDVEVASLHRDLAAIGDGRDETQLREEQRDLDPSLLAGEIELFEQRQAQLLHEIGDATAALREAQANLGRLAQGRDAAGAARERREAAGELVDIAERWVLRQTAARLAARAIERHRAAAQDPLIERAGALFALATSGAFAGLGADYDEADRPILAAKRASGERVRIEGLSEGARDQLFLSLRLALLERRAGEPLPFIGDDILASFDDERAACALAMLAEFGAARQTILFTHHAHVAEIARGMNRPAIEVVEM